MRVSIEKPGLLSFALLIFLVPPLFGAGSFEVTPLSYPRNMHGSTIVGDYLYVVGGDTPGGFTKSVQSAAIQPDQSLGPWLENTALPVNLIYLGNSVAATTTTIYVCGGQGVREMEGPTQYEKRDSPLTYFGQPGPSGIVGDWQKTEAWGAPQSIGTAAVTNGSHLYAIGGGSTAEEADGKLVYMAKLSPADGRPGSWMETSPLPEGRMFHAAHQHEGKIYVAGGRKPTGGQEISDLVFLAEILSDGTLADWQRGSQALEYPASSSAACGSRRYLFLFNGMTQDDQLLERVQFARLEANGLGEWKSTGTDLSARYYASAVLDQKRHAVYITGGRRTSYYLDINAKVYCYPLKAPSKPPEIPAKSSGEDQFYSYQEGRALAQKGNHNLLIYFYSENARASETLLNVLSQSSSFYRGIGETVPVAVNVFQQPGLARQFRISRLPAVVLVNPEGGVLRKTSGLLSQNEIVDFVNQ